VRTGARGAKRGGGLAEGQRGGDALLPRLLLRIPRRRRHADPLRHVRKPAGARRNDAESIFVGGDSRSSSGCGVANANEGNVVVAVVGGLDRELEGGEGEDDHLVLTRVLIQHLFSIYTGDCAFVDDDEEEDPADGDATKVGRYGDHDDEDAARRGAGRGRRVRTRE